MKEWVRFDRDHTKNIVDGKEYIMNIQEYLCKKYDIVLVDYKTKQERRIEKINNVLDGVFNGINKMCKGIDKMFNGIDKVLKVVEGIAVNMERETVPAKKRKRIQSDKSEWDGLF